MTDVVIGTITAVNAVVLVYFLLLNGGYLGMTIVAMAALRRHAERARSRDIADVLTVGAPPITLLAPAYNEEATCVEATTALLTLVYPDYEVLVVNDGSRDATLARLIEAFECVPTPRAPTADLPTQPVREVYRSRRRPNLWVIDKANGGKADALNVGINYCASGLFCAMDADTLLERDALARVVRPFLEDARTMAAGGIIRIINDSKVRIGLVEEVRLPRSWIARFQVLEYLRAFLAGRVGWDVIDAMLIISGAFGLFRRSLVVELGGYATDTVGEDMELVVRIHRHCRFNKIPYRVTFIPDPVAWTECPESLRVLGRQRDRWQRGLMQVLSRHRVMLLNPRYGRVGMLAFPYFFFLEGWGPVVEIAGYLSFAFALALGLWNPLYALAFFAVAFVFGAALSIAAVGLEELSFRRYERWRDLGRLILLSLLEPFGYRQLSTWWRAKGVVSAIRGVQGWGAMERRGFKTAPLILALLLPLPLSSQELRWTARATHSREVFRSNDAWDPWEMTEMSIGRRFASGSVAVSGFEARRFRRSDAGLSIDGYRTLWRGAYGNLRLQGVADAAVLPRVDVSAELFQNVRGWEPSVGARRMSFAEDDVTILAAGLGRYLDAWYGRARLAYATRNGASDGNVAGSALVRRYVGSSAEFAEIAAGVGGEAVTLGVSAAGGAIVDVRRTSFVAVGGQKYVARRVGIVGAVTSTTFELMPRRQGGTIGVMFRW